MLTSFLVVWYALGWVAVCMWCKTFDDLEVETFLSLLFGGLLTLGITLCAYLEIHARGKAVIWRRK